MNQRLSLLIVSFLICLSYTYAIEPKKMTIKSLETNNLRKSDIVVNNPLTNGTVSVTMEIISSKLSGENLEVVSNINIQNVENCSDIPVVYFTYNSSNIPQDIIDLNILKTNHKLTTCLGKITMKFLVDDTLPSTYYVYFGVLNSERTVEAKVIMTLNKKTNEMDIKSYCVIALVIFTFLVVVGLIGWTIFYCRRRMQTTTQETKGNIGESLLNSTAEDDDD